MNEKNERNVPIKKYADLFPMAYKYRMAIEDLLIRILVKKTPIQFPKIFCINNNNNNSFFYYLKAYKITCV